MSSAVVTSHDPWIDEIVNVILQLSAGRLKVRGKPAERGDELDAMLSGLNGLAMS